MTRTYRTALYSIAIPAAGIIGTLQSVPATAEHIRAIHTGTGNQQVHHHKLVAMTTFSKLHLPETPPNLVLMPVEGPQQVELDPSVIYRVKSHQADPVASEFSYLSGALQKSTLSVLKERLGSRAIARWQDTPASKESVSASAKRAGSRWTLLSTIEEVRFEGNVLLGPWYQMRVSCKLLDTGSGRVMWHMSNKKFEQFHKVDAGKRPAQVMEDVLLPKVSEYVAGEVQRVLTAHEPHGLSAHEQPGQTF